MMTSAQTIPLPSLSSNTWQILSALFDYPDQRLMDELDRIRAAANQIPEAAFRRAALTFLGYLESQNLIRLQETYTAAFDLHPDTTLNLTYHAFGNNEKRATAMAKLQRIYHLAGWEKTNTELPDYLPLVLEFLCFCPDLEPDHAQSLNNCLRSTKVLMKNLEKDAPAYAMLLTPLADLAHAGVKMDNRVTSSSFSKGEST